MLKRVILYFLLQISLNTLHSQVAIEKTDSCEYLESIPTKYNINKNNKFIEYRVFSPSSDYQTNLNLRYHVSDETISVTGAGPYPSSFEVHPPAKTLEITIHNYSPPEEKYLIEIILNDGKILKRTNRGREDDQTVYISTDIFQKTTVAKISPPVKFFLTKKQFKCLLNSTIKEIRINGETKVIEAEQAKIIQSGAVCLFEKIYNSK